MDSAISSMRLSLWPRVECGVVFWPWSEHGNLARLRHSYLHRDSSHGIHNQPVSWEYVVSPEENPYIAP